MEQETIQVLLVEDDEAHSGLIRHAFESHSGMELTVAASLEEARDCLGRFSPDLVIADLLLSDGRGTELLTDDGEESLFPVLIMTSFGNEQAAVEAMKAGALDYVVKSATTLADIPHIVERTLREWKHIIERREAENALRQAHEELEYKVKEGTADLRDSEAKFRTLFESTNDAVMLLDEKEFLECNDATLRIFGCSTSDEFIGKHPSEFSPPMQPDGTDSQTAARAKIALAIKTGKAQFEWLHCRTDGVEFSADVLLSSMELKGKTVLQAVVRDISERKRAEKAVLRERETLRRLLESSDRDRKLMAYEIHDGFTQQITGAKMQLEAYSQLKDENPERANQAFERGLGLLMQGLSEARHLISGLRPPILDEEGVVAAIRHLIHDTTVQEWLEPEFVADVGFSRLKPILENAIFRIVQESVTNARRHSKSDRVRIELVEQGGQVRIEVEDWGIGFDPESVSQAYFGLRGIKERARLLGGQATIDSTPGKGTLVRVELPLVESG